MSLHLDELYTDFLADRSSDVDVVKLRAQANASMPASYNSNIQLLILILISNNNSDFRFLSVEVAHFSEKMNVNYTSNEQKQIIGNITSGSDQCGSFGLSSGLAFRCLPISSSNNEEA